jgi:hypothetical protein
LVTKELAEIEIPLSELLKPPPALPPTGRLLMMLGKSD